VALEALMKMTEASNGSGKWPQQLGRVADVLRSRNGFLLIFTMTVLLGMVSYALHSPLIELPVNSQLGILGVLPLEYYLAIGLSLLLLFANLRNEKRGYFFASLLLVVFMFVCMEYIFLWNPIGNSDAYGHFFGGANLQDSGNPLLSYSSGNYPYGYFGSFVLTKMLVSVVGMKNTDTVMFLSIFKVAATLLFFSFLYFLLMRVMSTSNARLVTVIMVFANPYFQFHYSPQAFALIILPIFLYTIVAPRFDGKRMYAIQFLLFLFLMFTHGPTTIYLALAYFFATIILYYARSKKFADCRMNANIPLAIALLVGMLLTNPSAIRLIQITFAPINPIGYMPAGVNIIDIKGVPIFPVGVDFLGVERFGDNFFIPEIVRLVVLGISFVISAWGIWKIVKERRMDALNIFLVGAFVSMSLLTVGNILYPSLNMEDRSFLYLIFGGVILLNIIIPSRFTLSELLNTRKIKTRLRNGLLVLTVFLILAPMVNGLAYHYNNGIYFSAPQYTERDLFVMEHMSKITVFSYRDNHGLLLDGDRFAERQFWGIDFIDLKDFFAREESGSQQFRTCIVIAESTKWSYHLQEQDQDLARVTSFANSNMNLVYTTVGNSVWFAQS
jgi:hypothetical protein